VISFIGFSLRRAWQGFWRNALMSLAATATMVLMLLLLAGFWIIHTGLSAALDFTESKVNIEAKLADNAAEVQIQDLSARVAAMPEVAGVEFISRDQALERFRANRAAQHQDDLTKFLPSNPFHASIQISLRDPGQYAVIQERLTAEPIVSGVENIQNLVTRVLTITNVLRTGGAVILIVIGIIVLFIIVNTIRLAVFARAEEIEIMRLVGASDAFIRWPFVFEGALVGLLGALVTLTVLGIASDALSRFMFDFFRVLPLTFGSLARDLATIVFGAGVGLGIVGAWVSVRTYLIR
jgi:cell division transport system permease protein